MNASSHNQQLYWGAFTDTAQSQPPHGMSWNGSADALDSAASLSAAEKWKGILSSKLRGY